MYYNKKMFQIAFHIALEISYVIWFYHDYMKNDSYRLLPWCSNAMNPQFGIEPFNQMVFLPFI